MGRDEAAGCVQHAEPVPVAVAREHDVETPAGEGLPRGGEILGNRLGMDASEERIAGRAHGDDGRGMSGPNDLLEERPCGSVNRVEEHADPRLADRVEVDEGRERVAVRGGEVQRFDRAAGTLEQRLPRRAGDGVVGRGHRAAAER